ncbi:MAG TPA: peptidoglycan DD-metalloendopeptidase family protein [Acidimicrobiales bacterium]|nr:peptidoglycan DD-metalloendopeptidase family protein [Acidimicrobiales bacterium]
MVRAAALVLVGALVAGLVAPVRAAATPDRPEYAPMVVAVVVDPFRPPATSYGPGNRGLEYDTVPGQPVTAAADGEVTFAGAVAGALHVTVRHGDGTLTTASFVASVEVAVGDRVQRGDLLGRAGPRLHVGARVGGEYIDPATLFGTHERRVVLVPAEPAGRRAELAERARLAALTRLEGGGPGPLASVLGVAARVTGGALGGAGSVLGGLAASAHDTGRRVLDVGLAGTGLVLSSTIARAELILRHLVELTPVVRAWRLNERFEAVLRHRRHCTRLAGPPPPPTRSRRVAVLVAGLGSTSDHAAIGGVDTERLGYAPGDVVGFSYGGGRTPGRFGEGDGAGPLAAELAALPAAAYDADDSSTDLAVRAAHLAALLEAVAGATGGATVDVLAHSQGGIVTRLALADLATDPERRWVVARLGLVATIGSPHDGADLATSADLLGATHVGGALLQVADHLSGRPLDPAATTVGDLGERSATIAALDDHELPPGPHYLSIGGRGDLVVPAGRTALDGAHHVVVDATGLSAHDRLPADPGTTRELALGLAELAPSCAGVGDAVLDVAWSEAIDATLAGIGLAVGGLFGW